MAQSNATSGGRVKQIVATAREGTYRAKIKKKVTVTQVEKAAKKAEEKAEKRTYFSERAMWKHLHRAYAKEFGRIGIEITFEKQRKARNGKLVTQKIGTYETD